MRFWPVEMSIDNVDQVVVGGQEAKNGWRSLRPNFVGDSALIFRNFG